MALLVTDADVSRLDGVTIAIAAMENVYGLPDDAVGDPLRVDVPTGNGWLRVLAATIRGLDVFGYKAMNLTPGIGVRYVVSVYAISTGELLGVVDARELTTLRTAACAAVASRRLAKPGVSEIAVIGTGVEGRAQLTAMNALYPGAAVRAYSRQPFNRESFQRWAGESLGVEVTLSTGVAEAVEGAEVVVLATKSHQPVLTKELVAAGTHVISVGSARRDQYEIAPDAFPLFAPIVCDSPLHVLAEAGDAHDAVEAGLLPSAEVVGLSQLVRGEVPASAGTPTLYKSVGTAVQDLALAHGLLAQLRDGGESRASVLDGFPSIKRTS